MYLLLEGGIYVESNFIEVLTLFIVIYLFSMVIKLNGRVKGLKYTLEQISKQTGIPKNPIDNELKQLLNEGNNVKAVKRVRETLGFSLLEAKQYIDVLKSEGNWWLLTGALFQYRGLWSALFCYAANEAG